MVQLDDAQPFAGTEREIGGVHRRAAAKGERHACRIAEVVASGAASLAKAAEAKPNISASPVARASR
ncbi:MAG: hypothetical protein NZ523_05120 [Elioraea sp.]|nr:hypothetical protein [Elioraea sp.]